MVHGSWMDLTVILRVVFGTLCSGVPFRVRRLCEEAVFENNEIKSERC